MSQTCLIKDFVEKFSHLYDQLMAYEEFPNTVHYVTRFMEGLKPSVRISVGIHQLANLDTASDGASGGQAGAMPLPPC